MSEYFEEKLKTYKTALKTFEESLKIENPSRIEKDGTIQRYEYCFELTWKVLKLYLKEHLGIAEFNNPRAAISQAYLNNLVEDETAWIEMMKARNLAVHTYNEKFADQLFAKLPKYFKLMKDLEKKIS